MAAVPLLILGFNRPARTRALIESLRPSAPKHVVLAVDGPRSGKPADVELVLQTQNAVSLIDWSCTVETIFRDVNLGLRIAVADAVTQTVSKHGRVIVVEDDVIVGPNFLPYMTHALEKYEDVAGVAHVNGYNVVPPDILHHRQGDRFTRFIESFAWATWERSWRHYDPSLGWALNASTDDLRNVTGSLVGALRWRQIFKDASNEAIDTWAYRWLATIWSRAWRVVSPSENLVGYTGWTEGTHTRRKPKWEEQAVSTELLDFEDPAWTGEPIVSDAVDQWLGTSVFGESARGVLEGTAVSFLLAARNSIRRTRLRSPRH